MKKRTLFLILGLLIIIGCSEPEYLTCPDGVTQVLDLESCPEEKPKCPECDDGKKCTIDTCNQAYQDLN